MRTIDWVQGRIRLIDQRALPGSLQTLDVDDLDTLVEAIATLAVRGAMALGVAGALGVALACSRAAAAGDEVLAAAGSARGALQAARPTAVNLGWGAARVEQATRAAAATGALPRAVAAAALAEALRVRDEDIAASQALGEAGAELLAGVGRVLTHCNAGALAGVEGGSALAIIAALHAQRPLDDVLVCETRPLLQGARLTAWELGRLGIPHHVIVDSAAAGLLAGGAAQAVVVGADRIAANGDVANKVGTLGHALAARHAGVQFVVAAPESTIDPATPDGGAIPIEERDPTEVLAVGGYRLAAPGSPGRNPAFDVTPAEFVTAIVTERRIVRPGQGERPAP